MRNKHTWLLVHPEISRTRYNFKGVIENECLELEQLSAILKAEGQEVALWDGQVESLSLSAAVRRLAPQVVVVTGRCRQENFMLEYCRTAKKVNPQTVTILMGQHAGLCPDRLCRDGVDYVLSSCNLFHPVHLVSRFFGEEDLPVKDALGHEDTPALYDDLSQVEGLHYRREDGTFGGQKALPFDPNRLPLADRSYFRAHPDNYRYLELTHAAWVRTAYACPYRCTFCHRNRANAGTYMTRDIADVVEEIGAIPDRNIYLCDDDFLFDEERLREFVRRIRERGIRKTYICYGRADFIASHEELMAELKSIGFYYILVGLESISDRQLADYHKRTTQKVNEKAIRICARLDLHLMAMFILDLDFTRRDFRDLYRYVRRERLRQVAVSIYTPELGLPSSEAYKDRLITDNPSHYDYLHLVARPSKLGVKGYYLQYYLLLIRLFIRAWRQGVYDFIDYGDYIRSLIRNIFVKRKHDDE